MSDYPTLTVSDDVAASLRAGASKATTGQQLSSALPDPDLQTRASVGTPMTVLRYSQEVIRDGAVGYWPMGPHLVDGVDRVPVDGVYPYIVDPPPPPEAPVYLPVLVADGATHVWSLEENTATFTFADSVGSLPLASSPRTAADRVSAPIGPAVMSSPLCNGVGSPGDGGDTGKDSLWSASANLGSVGDFAIETWFKTAAQPGLLGIIMGVFSADLSQGFYLSLVGAGGGLNGSVGGQTIASLASCADNTPKLATLTRSGATVTLMVNGVVQATTTFATAQNLTAGRVQLGMLDYSGLNLYGFGGQLAWAAYFPVALTAAQALAHYTAGTP